MRRNKFKKETYKLKIPEGGLNPLTHLPPLNIYGPESRGQ